MLRRTKTIVFNDDPDRQNYDEPEPAALRNSARRGLDSGRPNLRKGPILATRDTEILPQRETIPDEQEQRPNPVHERVDFLRSEFENEPISRGSQDSLAALRAEFRRKHVDSGDDTSPGLPLPAFTLGGLKPSRLILIAVALIAGGLAAWLAVGRQPEVIPAPAVVQQVAPAITPPAVTTVEVLVAKAAIAVGTRLTPDLLEWQKWPEETVRAEYVTSAATPEAMTDLSGAVARSEVLPGEPIRREKLGQAGAGYLSAILEPGKRAVSVSIDAKSASGGFIMPNDHVDVVLTRSTATEQNSRTILSNVRVLAVNSRLGASEAEAATATPEESMFADTALATLELDPDEAELIINAANGGALSLVLRPTADAGESINAAQQAINQSIRLTSPFWLAPAGSNN